MQKFKKLLSVLLAMVMILSVATVGLVASAADGNKVEMPEGMTHEQVTNAIPKLDALINDIAVKAAGGNLSTLVEGGLYTNAMVGEFFKTVYNLLAGIDFSSMGFIGSMLANTIPPSTNEVANDLEKQYPGEYAGAVKALRDAHQAALDANGGKLDKKIDSWNYVEFKDGDWFKEKEASREEFAKACSLIVVGNVSDLLNMVVYSQTAYTQLYPALAKLDLDVPTIEELQKELVKIDPTWDGKVFPHEYWLEVTLNGVFKLVDEIAAKPIASLTNRLPGIAAFLKSGALNEALVGLIDNLDGMFSGMIPKDDFKATVSGLDITPSSLFATIGGLGLGDITYDPGSTNSLDEPNYPGTGNLVIKIAVSQPTTESDGQYITLKIGEEAFIKFMNTAETLVDEVEADGETKLVTDKAAVLVTSFRYIYNDIVMSNLSAVTDYLATIDPVIATAFAPAIKLIGKIPADGVFKAFISLVDPSVMVPQLPDIDVPDIGLPDFGDIELPGFGDEFPGLDEIFGAIGDFIGGIVSGGSGLGDMIGGIIGGIFGGGNDDTTGGDDTTTGGNDDTTTGGDDDTLGGDIDTDIPNTAGSKALASILVFGLLGGLGAGAGACVYKFKKDEE